MESSTLYSQLSQPISLHYPYQARGGIVLPSSSSSSVMPPPPPTTSPSFAKSLPQPIGRPDRTNSTSSEGFQKAPGAEVKSRSLEDDSQVQVGKDSSGLCKYQSGLKISN